MATTVVNFDGLSKEAAEKLSNSLAAGIRARAHEVGRFLESLESGGLVNVSEELQMEIAKALAESGGGGCGIGCC